MFILYKFADRKYYVGCILEQILDDQYVIKFTRKFGSRNGLITFIWPEDDDIQVKTSSDLQSMAAPLPDPATTRRGSVLFPAVTFNKRPLNQIY